MVDNYIYTDMVYKPKSNWYHLACVHDRISAGCARVRLHSCALGTRCGQDQLIAGHRMMVGSSWPIWSIYDIFTYIWVINRANVSTYSIHGAYGWHNAFFRGEITESCARMKDWDAVRMCTTLCRKQSQFRIWNEAKTQATMRLLTIIQCGINTFP